MISWAGPATWGNPHYPHNFRKLDCILWKVDFRISQILAAETASALATSPPRNRCQDLIIITTRLLAVPSARPNELDALKCARHSLACPSSGSGLSLMCREALLEAHMLNFSKNVMLAIVFHSNASHDSNSTEIMMREDNRYWGSLRKLENLHKKMMPQAP